MSLAGWALAELGLLFGLGAFAITGLYLLRMRRRQVEVPFAALWEKVTRESETRRLYRRLRRILSWLLQLLLLALVCLALGDPRPDSWLREPRTLAIVVDVSASTAAKGEDDRQRIEHLLERARAEVGALGPADRALIVAAGPEVWVPAPLSRSADVLRRGLDGLEPVPGEADFSRALTLASNALAGQPGARILVLTDGAVDEPSAAAIRECIGREAPECGLVSATGPTANVAITAFAARRYPGDRQKVEVLAEVQNLGPETAKVVLELEADGVGIGRRELELAPGEAKREILPRLDAARDRLVARLQPGEGADPAILGPAIDDKAWAVVPPLEPLDVVLVSDGTDLFLHAALLTLDDHVSLTFLEPQEGTADHPAMEEAALVVYDLGAAPLPEPLPATNLMVFDPHRVEGSPFPIAKAKDLVRPRLTEQDRKHDLVRELVFKDVNMHRGTSFDVQPGDFALVSHLGDPIVALRETPNAAYLGIGFDPRQSDLPLRVAFPLLVANSVDYFARRDAGFVAAVPVGKSRELALGDLGLDDPTVRVVEIEAPGESTPRRMFVDEGRIRLRALVPGVHVIRAVDGDSAGVEVAVAVNQADVAASALASALDEEFVSAADPGSAPDPTPVGDGPLWTLILLTVAGLVAFEWATYHRRQTV